MLLEAGIHIANQPTESRQLSSFIGEMLDARNVDSSTDHQLPFEMRLLHFRRISNAFFEKLFTLHSRVERVIAQGEELGRDAWHYYDLAMLHDQPRTRVMLSSEEFKVICGQYRDLTAMFYPGQMKLLPNGMDLPESPALFPSDDLKRMLSGAYVQEADTLCYGSYPDFDEILEGFEGIQTSLRIHI